MGELQNRGRLGSQDLNVRQPAHPPSPLLSGLFASRLLPSAPRLGCEFPIPLESGPGHSDGRQRQNPYYDIACSQEPTRRCNEPCKRSLAIQPRPQHALHVKAQRPSRALPRSSHAGRHACSEPYQDIAIHHSAVCSSFARRLDSPEPGRAQEPQLILTAEASRQASSATSLCRTSGGNISVPQQRLPSRYEVYLQPELVSPRPRPPSVQHWCPRYYNLRVASAHPLSLRELQTPERAPANNPDPARADLPLTGWPLPHRTLFTALVSVVSGPS